MHFFLIENLMGVGASGKLSSRGVRDPRAFHPVSPPSTLSYEEGGEGSGGQEGWGHGEAHLL